MRIRTGCLADYRNFDIWIFLVEKSTFHLWMDLGFDSGTGIYRDEMVSMDDYGADWKSPYCCLRLKLRYE